MRRRTYIASATALSVGASGCLGLGEGGPGEENETTNETDTEDVSEEPVETEGNDSDEEPADESIALETIDDFEDIAAWDVAIGSLSGVDEPVYEGSQAALLEASGAEEQVRISRLFDEPIDLSGMSPGLAVRSEETVVPVIQVIDADGDRIDFKQEVDGGPFVRANFGIGAVEGDPDLSEVAQINVVAWIGEERSARLWIDDLYAVERSEEGIVLLSFEGGYETTYTNGFPVLDSYDLPATVFVPTDRVRGGDHHEGDRLTEDQLDELQGAGWTIGSYAAHGLDLTALEGDRTPESELADAVEWLEENGYEDGAGYLAYPNGEYDQEVYDLAEEYYDLAFVGRYPAQGSIVNPSLASRVPDPSADEASRALEWTAEYGGITVLSYFALEESLGAFESAVEQLADLEGSGDVRVALPPDLESEYVV